MSQNATTHPSGIEGLKPIEVREARSKDDRLAAYALRFTVYVEEMGRRQLHADHSRRLIEEPEDAHARLLVARTAAGEVVGTARVHLKTDVPPALEALYGMRRFAPFHPAQTSTTTKLMVVPRLRRSPLALRLAQACYDLGMAEGIAFNFIDCNAPMRPFFERLGFRQLLDDFDHPDFGRVSPLVLAMHDIEYFRRIRTPFILPALPGDHASIAFFAQLLDHAHSPTAHP